MTLKGFITRLVLMALITWILVGFTESLGWALYFALMPIFYYEILRPRPSARARNNHTDDTLQRLLRSWQTQLRTALLYKLPSLRLVVRPGLPLLPGCLSSASSQASRSGSLSKT